MARRVMTWGSATTTEAKSSPPEHSLSYCKSECLRLPPRWNPVPLRSALKAHSGTSGPPWTAGVGTVCAPA